MIIGLSGKAQSGKNTVYDMIVYTFHYWNYYYKMQQSGYIEFKEDFSLKHFKEVINTYVKGNHYGIHQLSFASSLKECLATICGCDVENFEDINFKNSEVDWLKGFTYRKLLQKFGTAVRNEVCDDFWVKAAFRNVNLEDDDVYVFTDVRFKSEAEAIKQQGGLLIRINREGSGAGNHISETELDNYKFDIVINNNGNLEDLLEQVRILCKNLKLI